MPAPWPHVHVSEREVAHTWPDGQKDDSHWEDCLWCSVVEWLNDTYKDVPDTLAYAEKLRDAGGEPPTGGSNFGDVQAAFNKLGIPITLHPLKIDALATALKPGTAAVVTGNMGNFPAGHHLRRWDPGFAGGHAVYVARLKDNTLWWCDPLAPKGTYQGEAITGSQLRVFMGSVWTGVVRPVRAQPATPTGDEMTAISVYQPGYTCVVKKTANVRADAKINATILRVVSTPETWTIIGQCKGDVDPDTGKNDWVFRWANGRYEYTAIGNLSSGPTKPATGTDDGITQATVDAAVQAQKTKDAALLSAAVDRAKTDATSAEHERIALAEADRIRRI